jgi:hypothetical protein
MEQPSIPLNINQVRQVLMNELGLTKSSIRDLVEQIVTVEVAKHFNRMGRSGSSMTWYIKRLMTSLAPGNIHKELCTHFYVRPFVR